MRRNQNIAACCLVALLVCPTTLLAGGLYVPGVGVRASAMGGAFVGLADDYSAVYWNPAGIHQINGFQATVTLQDVISVASRNADIRFDGVTNPAKPAVWSAIEATSETGHYVVPGIYLYMDGGALAGIADKFGICAYTLADYGVKWDGDDLYDDIMSRYETLPGDPAGYREIIGEAPDFESHIQGYVVSPVLAKKFSDRLSIGIAAHVMYASFTLRDGGWYEVSYEDSSKLYPYQTNEELTGTGYGATIGILYDVNRQISVGATVRTPMTVTFEGDIEVDSPLAMLASDKQSEDFDFTFPLWAVGGIAYRDFLFDGLTLAADVQWTQWSEVTGFTRNMTTALPEDVDLLTDLKWDNALGVHVGFDYKMSRSTSLMFGFASEPGLAAASDLSIVMPQQGHSSFSFGFRQRQDRWVLDVSLFYHIGESVSRPTETDTNGDYSQGKNVHDQIIPGVAFSYLF
ncbi:outer membrane protein transport protein [bacterium]|nr:outer membrane protein transport protein [bacterium]